MKPYTVSTIYVSGRDGEDAFDTLAQAQADFSDTSNDRTKVSVELWDNSGDEPALIASRSCQ